MAAVPSYPTRMAFRIMLRISEALSLRRTDLRLTQDPPVISVRPEAPGNKARKGVRSRSPRISWKAVNGAGKSGHCGGVMVAHLYYARNSSEDCNSPNPYPSTCWMVQRLTSRRLASSRWLTPLDRSSRMYSRCCSVRTGSRPGKRPSVRAFA